MDGAQLAENKTQNEDVTQKQNQAIESLNAENKQLKEKLNEQEAAVQVKDALLNCKESEFISLLLAKEKEIKHLKMAGSA